MDVEAVDVRCARLFHGDQSRPALFGNEAEDRILCVFPRVRKIDPRGEALEEARSHDAERNMRRLQRVARAGHTAGTNGAKAERALLVRRAAAKTDEGGIEGRLCSRILGMRVTARGVGLPNLDQGIETDPTSSFLDKATEKIRAAREAAALDSAGVSATAETIAPSITPVDPALVQPRETAVPEPVLPENPHGKHEWL